ERAVGGPALKDQARRQLAKERPVAAVRSPAPKSRPQSAELAAPQPAVSSAASRAALLEARRAEVQERQLVAWSAPQSVELAEPRSELSSGRRPAAPSEAPLVESAAPRPVEWSAQEAVGRSAVQPVASLDAAPE